MLDVAGAHLDGALDGEVELLKGLAGRHAGLPDPRLAAGPSQADTSDSKSVCTDRS